MSPRNRLKRLRMGGRTWTLGYLPSASMDGAAGLCHLGAEHIDIDATQSAFDETDTVIHEVMHAILYCQGRPHGGKTEETYVRALATGLTTVLYDNPEFAKWLLTRTPK